MTNASNFIRGYDPETGVERWRLGGSSKITAPTPVFADGIIVVASGRAPERPIFAIRPGGKGDISLRSGEAANASIAWSKTGRGSYMPTPLIYQGIVYVLGNAGLFDAYDLKTGREVFRQRLEHQGSGFSASPVAVDGRIYLSSEDGDVFVVRGDTGFELIAKNSMGEPLMSTPALADGQMYVRGERHLFAVGQKQLADYPLCLSRGEPALHVLERLRPVVAEQPRERAVRQQPSAGLALCAVVGLVARIDDALHRSAADRTRLTIAAVNGHAARGRP